MNFKEYPDRDLLILGLVDRLASELTMGGLQHQERVSLAVPGGDHAGGAGVRWAFGGQVGLGPG